MRSVLAMILLIAAAQTTAAGPQVLLKGYEAQVRRENPAFNGFSAQRGAAFYRARHPVKGGGEIGCGSCHSDDPRGPGKHRRTGKPIEPLAPSANPKRFADPAKTEKWFQRNCRDVLARQCSSQEKGDFLLYLLTLK